MSICRKLSRGWNNFELMVSICRKLNPGRNQKKKVSTLAQLFQPPTNCNPVLGMYDRVAYDGIDVLATERGKSSSLQWANYLWLA